MAYSKQRSFSSHEQYLAGIAKALSHPARISILRVLAQKNSCICGDIVDELPLAQSTVSQHLKELKNAGLIEGEVEGPRVCYCLNHTNWQKASDAIRTLFTDLLTCC